MSRRTLRLTEYRPREVRLRRADVDALLAHLNKPIEVLPTHQRGRYRLTFRVVGPREMCSRSVTRLLKSVNQTMGQSDADQGRRKSANVDCTRGSWQP